jgi:hypothetical protein
MQGVLWRCRRDEGERIRRRRHRSRHSIHRRGRRVEQHFDATSNPKLSVFKTTRAWKLIESQNGESCGNNPAIGIWLPGPTELLGIKLHVPVNICGQKILMAQNHYGVWQPLEPDDSGSYRAASPTACSAANCTDLRACSYIPKNST